MKSRKWSGSDEEVDLGAGSMTDGSTILRKKRRAERAAAEAAPQPSRPSGFNLSGLFHGFRRRWAAALVAGCLLGSAAAASAWFLLPPKYSTYATLRVSSVEQKILPDRAGLVGAEAAEYKKTQLALIRSRHVLQAALRADKVKGTPTVLEQPDPVAWLEKELKVGYVDNTDVLRITLAGQNPSDITAIVNAVKDTYLKEVVSSERDENKARLTEIEDIYIASENKVRSQRELLRKLAETLKTSDSQALTLKQKIALEEYAAVKKEFAQVQSQLRAGRAALEVQEMGARLLKEGRPIPETVIERQLEADPSVQQQLQEVRRMEDRVRSAQGVLRDGVAVPPHYSADLETARQRLEDIKKTRRDAVVKQLRERTYDETLAQVAQSQEQIAVWEKQLADLGQEVGRLGKEAELIGTTSFELELKRAEIEEAEAFIKKLRAEKQRLEVELQSTKPRVKLLAAAEVPAVKNAQSEIQTAVLAGLAGLLGGALGVSLWEARARRISSSDQVSKELGMRVVGALPVLPPQFLLPSSGTVPPDERDGYWRHMLAESVAGIRTMLVCDDDEELSRVIMVTSACEGEGKTTLASLLAASIARSGHKVVLIDSDLHAPTLHASLNLPAGPGLSEVLRGEADLAEAVRPTPVPGLFVLTAGFLRGNPARPLRRREVRALFKTLKGEYDYLVIDTCPVLPVHDTLVIGKQVDAVLLAVRPDVSKAPSVQAAVDRLRSLNIKVFGAVINGVSRRDRMSAGLYLPRESGYQGPGEGQAETTPAAFDSPPENAPAGS